VTTYRSARPGPFGQVVVISAGPVGLDIVPGGRCRAAVDRDPTTHARHRPSPLVNDPRNGARPAQLGGPIYETFVACVPLVWCVSARRSSKRFRGRHGSSSGWRVCWRCRCWGRRSMGRPDRGGVAKFVADRRFVPYRMTSPSRNHHSDGPNGARGAADTNSPGPWSYDVPLMGTARIWPVCGCLGDGLRRANMRWRACRWPTRSRTSSSGKYVSEEGGVRRRHECVIAA